MPSMHASHSAASLEIELARKLAVLDDASRAIKFQCNALVPAVAHLPPELLSQIFEHVRGFCTFPLNPPSFETVTHIQWIRVTHVCHTWRDVPFRCPRLWSCIDLLFGSPWVCEMLSRSNMAPLSFKGTITSAHLPTIQSLPRHASRLHELSLTAPPSHSICLASLMTDICALCAAPLLEHLSISFYEPIVLLPGIFLPRCRPSPTSLSRLLLRNCILPWGEFVPPPSLTALEITFTTSIINEIAPYVVQVVGILQGALLLENLTLKRALFDIPHPAQVFPTPERTVNLPHLAVLFIESGVVECSALLDHLLFPPLTSQHRLQRVINAPPNATLRLLPSLTYWADLLLKDDTPDLTIAEMKYTCEYENFCSLVLQLCPPAPSLPVLDLRLRLSPHDEDDIFVDWTSFLPILPLPSLVRLSIHDLPWEFPYPDDSWLGPFAHLPSLKEINASGCITAHGVVDALAVQVSEFYLNEDQGWDELEEGIPLVYPAIGSLGIRVYGDLDFGWESLTRLLEFLHWRKARVRASRWYD